MIVPNIENPFFSEIAKAVEAEAFQNGYKMLLCNSANNPKKERMNIQMLVQMQADGIVIMTNSDRTGKKIAECGLPVVVMAESFLRDGKSHLSNQIITKAENLRQSI